MDRAELEPLQYDFERAVLSLDHLAARRLADAWGSRLPPLVLVEQVIGPVLTRLGAGWEQGRVALAQIYVAGRMAEELVDRLLPRAGPGRIGRPRIAIAVFEDHHRLGKRIVGSTLRAAGHELVDLGHGTVDDLPDRVLSGGIEVLLLSSLMLASALRIKNLVRRLDDAGAPTRVVVGGAPFRFDPELWREVGAHAWGPDAASAVTIVRRLGEEVGA